jgi:hypothetical protein
MLSRERRGNLRGSGIGMALVSALARRLPEGEPLPEPYDDLLKLTPATECSIVMQHLPQARRDALAVRILTHDARAITGVHQSVQALLQLVDHVTGSAVATLALQIADKVAADGSLKMTAPDEAEDLRRRVIERFGDG